MTVPTNCGRESWPLGRAVCTAGLGEGRQQLSFLPEAHTDFIFAIVGEEGGLFFTLVWCFYS